MPINSIWFRKYLPRKISRAVYPVSELETTRWIKKNSSVCEQTGYGIKKITKDHLYRISKNGMPKKRSVGASTCLFARTNCFDIEDRIRFRPDKCLFWRLEIRYPIGEYGWSKKKRSGAKLVVLALVVNPQCAIKYSSILEGNMVDSNALCNTVLLCFNSCIK